MSLDGTNTLDEDNKDVVKKINEIHNILYSDEKKFSDFEKNNVSDLNLIDYKRLILIDLYNKSKLIENGFIGDYKYEDIKHMLIYPKENWRKILGLSETLMRISPHYYRLNMTISNMALFNYSIDLFGVKEGYDISYIKKKYIQLAEKLDKMNLKDEFHKIMKQLPYLDLYCGLLVENKNECFIQPINIKVLKLYKIEDGLYNFKIDFSKISIYEIDSYPLYIREEYYNYLNENSNSNWYEPPSDKQICIKMNRQWVFPYPFMISLIKDIFDLDLYKKLQLQSARTDNYKAILSKIPIDESSVNKPLITTELLQVFTEINRASMTDDIGMIYGLGTDPKAISFKDSNNSRNNVADSVSNIYDFSGITKELFNGSSSGTAVTLSMENLSGFVYSLYRQFERWLNRFQNIRRYSNSNFNFKINILDMTIFNKDNVSKKYQDACTLGATVIDKWLVSLNMTPSSILGSYIINNEIFDFHNNLTPIKSTYTSSDTVNNNVGRPTVEETGDILSDKGEETRDSDANIDR